uniref:Peroxidasin n=2 Tax=Aceria tosichella TaxID=561515 RepID=A0A6G1SBU1_9ACAR
MEQLRTRRPSALVGCLCLVAALSFTHNQPSLHAQAHQYGDHYSPDELGPHYESEILAAAYQHQQSSSSAASSGQSASYSNNCVLTIKQYNASASSSYSTALAATTDSYLPNYVSSGRREPYKHKGRSICITQHDVDQAVEEAKASLGGYVPKEIYTANSEVPKPMQVTIIAEIITQATRILANRFKLPEPAILYDLPAIDQSKSRAIDYICPVFLKPGVNCEQTKYRTLTGYCNNLQYQSWGSSRSAMVRFLAPDYYDSISLPRRAYDGSPLPSARVVSFVVHQDPQEYDRYHSMFGVVWGQFINHDVNLAVRASDEDPSTEKIDCCKSEDSHPDCFPIEIPKGDPFYGYFNQKCMHFTRASSGLQPGCSLGPIQPMNKQSAYLDASLVYGFGIKTANRLRSFYQGQLRTQPVNSALAYGSSSGSGSQEYVSSSQPEQPLDPVTADYLVASGSRQHQEQRQLNGLDVAASTGYGSGLESAQYQQPAAPLKELMPANKYSPDTGCERRGRPKDVYCFDAGDTRANEQISLATMHTIFVREHNRLAKELSYVNPHWNDERLYQEARKIVAAEIQHITYNEFLPLVIGKEKIQEYGLNLAPPGEYYHGYDAKINSGVRVEFQAAAFRYGHSLVPSYIERYNKYHQKIESIRLSKLLKQPYDLYHPGVLDTYILGLADQRSGRMDPTLSTEISNHLFEKPGKFFGLDLAAINIQRGRENGIPGYNHLREFCGLPRAKYFEDLTGVFSNKTLLRMAQLYKHVDDIDLFTAGISEYPVQDGLVGPTFGCLIARQFAVLRAGDRFWYENGGYNAQFSLYQLDEIRKQTAARLMCDNSDSIYDIQASALLIADPYTNPRVPCSSLPGIDLSKWKEESSYEPKPQQQQQQQQQYPSGQPQEYQPNALAMEYEPVVAAPQSEEYPRMPNSASNGQQQQQQPSMEAYLPTSGDEYEPMKTTSHFVDHVVESSSDYRAEPPTGYQSSAKA